jgi:hypothetical protein
VPGKSADAATVSGTVKVRINGTWRTLGPGESIPMGTTVDTRAGVVEITSAADSAGTPQTAQFGSGMFVINQTPGPQLITDLVLTGGDFGGCPTVRAAASRKAKARSAAVTKVRKKKKQTATQRKLWGDGHGRFRTRGRYGSATVRGTRWTTADRCDGTQVAVERGVVAVSDFTRRRTVLVPAGKIYLARAPKGRTASVRRK